MILRNYHHGAKFVVSLKMFLVFLPNSLSFLPVVIYNACLSCIFVNTKENQGARTLTPSLIENTRHVVSLDDYLVY